MKVNVSGHKLNLIKQCRAGTVPLFLFALERQVKLHADYQDASGVGNEKYCFPSVDFYTPTGVITLLWLFNYLVVHCPELKPPENGYFVQNVCNNYFNAACGIRCKAGFDLVGSSIRLCQPNGQWSGSEATCRGMDVCLQSLFLQG